MISRPLGRTGLTVSAIGLGCGPLGDPRLDDHAAERLVHEAQDLGINVFDTAPSYGASEERLGRALEGRRGASLVVTKCGYGIPNVPDWTPECITLGLERALRVLRTDVVDVLLFHSCDVWALRRGELVAALLRAKESGKARAIGYSGDGEALAYAVDSGLFDVVECSVNVLDQSGLGVVARSGLGVLAKRSLANAIWQKPATQGRPDLDEYTSRFEAFFGAPDPFLGVPLDELFVRFAAHAESVSCALVGTSRIEGLRRAAQLASRGPLAEPITSELSLRYEPHAAAFFGLV